MPLKRKIANETKGSKSDETGHDFLFLDTIKAAVAETYATLYVNETDVKMKLDTGAEVNVIPITPVKSSQVLQRNIKKNNN